MLIAAMPSAPSPAINASTKEETDSRPGNLAVAAPVAHRRNWTTGIRPSMYEGEPLGSIDALTLLVTSSLAMRSATAVRLPMPHVASVVLTCARAAEGDA